MGSCIVVRIVLLSTLLAIESDMMPLKLVRSQRSPFGNFTKSLNFQSMGKSSAFQTLPNRVNRTSSKIHSPFPSLGLQCIFYFRFSSRTSSYGQWWDLWKVCLDLKGWAVAPFSD